LRHEGAVVSADAGTEFVGGFAPGSGQFAEEILEEEDSEGPTLHASSIEEMDDLDEETVDGAADLGTMLREMSIDHITRTMPEVEDEDDSEEEDLEEDDLDEDDEEEEDEEVDDLEGQEPYQLERRADADQAGLSEDDAQEQEARSGNAGDAEFFEQQFGQGAGDNRSEEKRASAPGLDSNRDPSRDSERRGGRRDGRRGQRGDRDRSDRSRGGRTGHSNGHGRHSMQSTNLPAISDLLKPGQEILVQIAKEPIAKKGARITSHIALPGRFLVFMPTVTHIGVSRKIASDEERQRLKRVLVNERGEASGGF